MSGAAGLAAALALGAELLVPAGAPLDEALARARPGDVIRLGPGEHRGALGRPAGIAVEGAGAGRTVLLVPPGADGVVAEGALSLAGLTVVAGPNRSALKVLGGAVRARDVALVGGACGAFLDGGRLDGTDLWLEGDYGLLARRGEVAIAGAVARGRLAGVALLAGALRLERAAVTGPSAEAGISVAGGTARLDQVVIRAPGPAGLAVSHGAVEARDLAVAGATEVQGFLGACVQARRATVRLESSELSGCAGAALEASRSEVRLEGVDAEGGEAGCLVLVDQSRAALFATLCGRRGPGLVATQGSTVTGRGARFWTDPAMWVECGSGARVELEGGPEDRRPCTPPP